MLSKEHLGSILFIDIETVSQFADFSGLQTNNPALAACWVKKAQKLLKDSSIEPTETNIAQAYIDKAALYGEFAKIICIGFGEFEINEDNSDIRLKAATHIGETEEELLLKTQSYLKARANRILCAHNIDGFDYPVLCKRFLYNRIELPTILNTYGVKPWNRKLMDTMQIVMFGTREMVSLDLLCAAMNIKSPKETFSAEKVGEEYWIKNNIKDIREYCKGDVRACMEFILAISY